MPSRPKSVLGNWGMMVYTLKQTFLNKKTKAVLHTGEQLLFFYVRLYAFVQFEQKWQARTLK